MKNKNIRWKSNTLESTNVNENKSSKIESLSWRGNINVSESESARKRKEVYSL